MFTIWNNGFVLADESYRPNFRQPLGQRKLLISHLLLSASPRQQKLANFCRKPSIVADES
jgi:hypothetical protein